MPMLSNPAVIVFDFNGNPVALQNGATIPGTQGALLVSGRDGSGNAIQLAVNGAGNPVIVGSGIPGTPSSGVLTVQGIGGGTPLPVSFSGFVIGPLTDTQLRATPVPVSGSLTITEELNSQNTQVIDLLKEIAYRLARVELQLSLMTDEELTEGDIDVH